MGEMKKNEKNEEFITTEVKTLLRGSLLMLKAVVTPSQRRYLNPATAYEEAQREVHQERITTQTQNMGRSGPTP
jgi:hypothetical protein